MKNISVENNLWGTVLKTTILVLVGFVLVYLAVIAVTLKVNYYDTYDIWLNSRLLAGGEGFFCWERAAFLPILLSPIFVLEKYISLPDFSMITSRVVSVLLFGFLLWIAYKFLRLRFEKMIALPVVMLIALNRMFVHYAPFVKEDMPATFFLITGFYCYIKASISSKHKYFIYSSVALTCAVLTRYNMVPSVIFLVVLYEIVTGVAKFSSPGQRPLFHMRLYYKKVFLFIVVPLSCVILVPSIYYYLLGVAPLWQSTQKFIFYSRALLADVMQKENPNQNYSFLVIAMTWPVVVLAFLGLIKRFSFKKQIILFNCLWFFVFFLIQTYLIEHKEARYIMPVFFPVYFYFALGLEVGVKLCRDTLKKLPGDRKFYTFIAGVVLFLIFYSPIKNGLLEMWKFQDPVYSTDFEYKVGNYSKELSEDKRVFWAGTLYTLYPKDYVFHKEASFFYIYHFHKKAIKFLAGKMPVEFADKVHIYGKQPLKGVFAEEMLRVVQDGDVIIINPETLRYETKSVHLDKGRPLVVEKVRRLDFLPFGNLDSFKKIFKPENNESSVIIITREPEGINISGLGIPLNKVELFVSSKGIKQNIFSDIPVISGRFSMNLPKGFDKEIDGISAVGFSNVKVFYPPKSTN